MKILVLHGPNLNLLGSRDINLYGGLTLSSINSILSQKATELGIEIEVFQSNHEGEIIDMIQQKTKDISGILINPAAFTHYSYAIRDALVDSKLPVVEVHLSDISKREDFRNVDVLDGIVVERIMGLKDLSYVRGLERIVLAIKGT